MSAWSLTSETESKSILYVKEKRYEFISLDWMDVSQYLPLSLQNTSASSI